MGNHSIKIMEAAQPAGVSMVACHFSLILEWFESDWLRCYADIATALIIHGCGCTGMVATLRAVVTNAVESVIVTAIDHFIESTPYGICSR